MLIMSFLISPLVLIDNDSYFRTRISLKISVLMDEMPYPGEDFFFWLVCLKKKPGKF